MKQETFYRSANVASTAADGNLFFIHPEDRTRYPWKLGSIVKIPRGWFQRRTYRPTRDRKVSGDVEALVQTITIDKETEPERILESTKTVSHQWNTTGSAGIEGAKLEIEFKTSKKKKTWFLYGIAGGETWRITDDEDYKTVSDKVFNLRKRPWTSYHVVTEVRRCKSFAFHEGTIEAGSSSGTVGVEMEKLAFLTGTPGGLRFKRSEEQELVTFNKTTIKEKPDAGYTYAIRLEHFPLSDLKNKGQNAGPRQEPELTDTQRRSDGSIGARFHRFWLKDR